MSKSNLSPLASESYAVCNTDGDVLDFFPTLKQAKGGMRDMVESDMEAGHGEEMYTLYKLCGFAVVPKMPKVEIFECNPGDS